MGDWEEFFDLLAEVVDGNISLAPGLAKELLIGLALTENDEAGDLLSDPQLEVLRLVAQGITYRHVGDQLHPSEHTVRYHSPAGSIFWP